jgi:beta-galactosidase
MDDLHFAENGVRIWTPEVSDKQARVDLNIWVENEGQETRQIDDVEVTFQGGTFSFLDERPQMMYSPSVRFSNSAVRLPVALKTVVVDSETPAVQELKKIENVALKPGQVATYVLSYTIDQPHLWSPDAPYLYEATIRLKSEGRVIGEQRAKFGIRSFSFTA